MLTTRKVLSAVSAPFLLFILTVAVRLAVYLVFTSSQIDQNQQFPFAFPDSYNFYDYSDNLLQHGTYVDGSGRMAWRTPGYSLLLAGVMKFAGSNVFWWRMLNLCLAGFCSILAWSTARRMWGNWPGIIAGLLIACYPAMAYLDTLILAETLGVFTMLLAVRLLIEAVLSGKGSWAAACGLSCALATMTKASFGGLFILFAVYLLVCWWGRLHFRSLILSALLVGAFCVGMTPWVVRNNIALKGFVPLSTMGGFTLWECTGPGADGGANNDKVAFPEVWLGTMQNLENGNRFNDDGVSNEILADRYLKGQCEKVMRGDLDRTFDLSVKKFRRTWNPVPNWSGAAGWKFAVGMAGFYVPVMLLSLCGVLLLRKNWREVYCLLLPALYLACVHSVFMGSIRYRLAAMPVLAVLAAGTMWHVYGRIRRKA